MAERRVIFSESQFGLDDILHQLTSLRRENRFLKVGLILCFVFAVLPYLIGFQPETISAKRVVTEKVEFISEMGQQ